MLEDGYVILSDPFLERPEPRTAAKQNAKGRLFTERLTTRNEFSTTPPSHSAGVTAGHSKGHGGFSPRHAGRSRHFCVIERSFVGIEACDYTIPIRRLFETSFIRRAEAVQTLDEMQRLKPVFFWNRPSTFHVPRVDEKRFTALRAIDQRRALYRFFGSAAFGPGHRNPRIRTGVKSYDPSQATRARPFGPQAPR